MDMQCHVPDMSILNLNEVESVKPNSCLLEVEEGAKGEPLEA
jgi:hypothetical protein